MEYFFIRTNAINLLLAINTAKTRFLILEQFCWMAATIDSRIADANGSIRTECVRKINGLFETKIEKKTRK